MGVFDYLKCDYPLPDGENNSKEFQTKSFDGALDRLLITKKGRLLRGADDTEFHGDFTFGSSMATYKVRFTEGKLQWIKKIG